MKKFRLLTLLVALLLALTTGAKPGWTGGTYTATADQDLSNGITVSDDATLTINSDVTVTVTGGITISEGKTLTVVGPGTLVVSGTNGNNPSYGGGNGGNGSAAVSGTIVVQDGANVTATGGYGGKGGDDEVWSGRGGDGGAAFSGAVTIYGGTISAKGGKGGNGGGFDSETGGDGGTGGFAFAGTLTYYGGRVTATGGNGGGSYKNNGDPGRAFASDVTFVNAPTSLTDGSNGIDQSAVTTYVTVNISGPDVDVNPASYSVTMPQDTDDASNWTGKAGTATTFSALPLENVAQGDAVTLKYSGDRRVKTVTATLLQMQSLTVAKGSTELSGDKVLYYLPGDTYRQALARTENQSTGGLGWGYWEDSSLTTIYFKEVSTKAWDVAIDGDSNFGSGKGSCTITLDTEINPTGHTFQFVNSQ